MLSERRCAWVAVVLLVVLPLLPLADWFHPHGRGAMYGFVDADWFLRFMVFSLPMLVSAALYGLMRPAAVSGATLATAAVFYGWLFGRVCCWRVWAGWCWLL